MTECFMVLNTLSSLKEIKPEERELLAARLNNAQQTCNIKLKQINEIIEVQDYIANKINPGQV